MTAWRYSINYGPDGEANYANVHAADGQFVGNLRTHHAIAICNAFAVCEKLAATPSSPVSAPSGGVREAVARAMFNRRHPFESWASFNERYEARGNCLHPMQEEALADADTAIATIAALSSPATPEPVSASAGEVVRAMGFVAKTAEDVHAAIRNAIRLCQISASDCLEENSERQKLRLEVFRALEMPTINSGQAAVTARRIEAALSNPAPGHGEGGL